MARQVASLERYFLPDPEGRDVGQDVNIKDAMRHALVSSMVAAKHDGTANPQFYWEHQAGEDGAIAAVPRFDGFPAPDDMGREVDWGHFLTMQHNGFDVLTGGLESFMQQRNDRIVGRIVSSVDGVHSVALGVQ